MVIPPINEEPTLHFGLLRKIAHRNGLTGLSMGMSSDFESAIAMGSDTYSSRLSNYLANVTIPKSFIL